MSDFLDVGDQPKDYWTPEERQARAERRRERQRKAEAFAEAFVREGSLSGAAHALWPQMPHGKAYDKARHLSQTQVFREALPKITRRIEVETAIGPEWVLRRLRIQAETAVRAADRIRALELIGRHLGMFIERKEVRKLSVDLTRLSNNELMELARKKLNMLDVKR